MRCVPLLAVLGLCLVAGPASAAQTIGSALTASPTNLICGGCDASGVQTVKAAASPFPVSPSSDGVIVSLRLKHAFTNATPGDTFGIRLVTSLGGTTFGVRKPARALSTTFGTNVVSGVREIVPTDAAGQPQGVTIHPNELMSVSEDNEPGHSGPALMSAPQAGAQTQLGLGIVDSVSFDYPIGSANTELLVQATVEPDADGDEYGDETQDLCPTDATKQGECVAPSALLGKHPKKKSKSATASFKFSSDDPAATFQCAIDKKALKACNSPKKFKKLKARKHKFQLVATDAAGNASAPTVFRWRVVD
ncbi:MAG: hypothetical protein QOG62_668 [Thermoleophilaceae bacterium]|nr:hypothetical protein [Thermoleophilaceae bacterium]